MPTIICLFFDQSWNVSAPKQSISHNTIMQNSSDEQTIEQFYKELKAYTHAVRRDHRLSGQNINTVSVRSAVCGSTLTLDAIIEHDQVQELGWRVRACSLGQATTAIVIAHLNDLKINQVAMIGGQLEAILKGQRDTADWPELAIFSFARDIPSRHGSAMLPFKALKQLFEHARK